MVLIALAALAARAPQQLFIASWQNILVYGLGHAVLYRALYALIVCRWSPWKTALLWLGSPLLLFSATWLRPVWAVVFTTCWAAALWWSIRQHSPAETKTETKKMTGVAGYLVVLMWVSVCGAGGYGYQSSDYVMHNGRLLDLIHYSWPVRYVLPDGSHQILVQYAGYYLWPALAGKLAGESVAMLVQHLWLLAGCWIALRMLVVLTNVRTWLAAAGLVLFGGWDIVGFSLYAVSENADTLSQLDPPSLKQLILTCLGAPSMLDFWPAVWLVKDIWFGNFISLASSLLLSPHQVVAGWIAVGLLYRAWHQQAVFANLFACALLAYYAPMIALGLLPMLLVLAGWQLSHVGLRKFSIFSVFAGVTVLGVLGLYYTGVSVGNQPHGVLSFSDVNVFVFILFLLQSWVLYAVLVFLYRRWLDREMAIFACAVFFSAAVLSCVYYGVYNDLMVRSSSAVYYGILLVMLALFRSLWAAGTYWRAILLATLLLPGIFSGVSNVMLGALHADARVPGKSVVDYISGWQFLGRQDSWFVHHLSK